MKTLDASAYTSAGINAEQRAFEEQTVACIVDGKRWAAEQIARRQKASRK